MTTLASDDFRSGRRDIPDENFALVENGPEPSLDRIDRDDWIGLTSLPDDVLLRTTSFQGAIAGHCYYAWTAVVGSIPDPTATNPSPAFEVWLDLADHVRSSGFSALHGFYRQSFATLRTALEAALFTAHMTTFGGLAAVRTWRYEDETLPILKFAEDLDRLAATEACSRINEAMTPTSLARGQGRNREGWIWSTYQLLSRFAHVTPGYTDGELWQSNGPIWVPDLFVRYVASLREVVAICTLLAVMTDAEFRLGEDLETMFSLPGEEWFSAFHRGLQELRRYG